MKEIVKDEEITCDYSLNSDNEGTFQCRCGAKRCRKVYVGNYFKLPGEIQIEYLPYLEDWFTDLHKDKIDTWKNISIQ